MKNSIYLLISMLIMWGGCASSSHNAAYYQVWDATQRVFAKNNLLVQESRYSSDTIVAVSQVHGDFLSKSRVKIVAKIAEDQHGYWEPHIRVLNQWDNSDARTWGHPDHQPRSQWINLNTNAAMEARLYNEIQLEMGKHNLYEGKAWQPVARDEEGYGIPSNAEPIPLTPCD